MAYVIPLAIICLQTCFVFLHPPISVSATTEDLDMYVRSVSPSWNTQHR